MKKQNGFTLIELVIVIIILGILAATAVPKFVDLQTDARISMLNGAKGALEGGASLTQAQALVAGEEKNPAWTNGDMTVVFGFPAATSASLNTAVEFSSNDWVVTEDNSVGTTVGDNAVLSIAGYSDQETCVVTYTIEASPARPTITVDPSGC